MFWAAALQCDSVYSFNVPCQKLQSFRKYSFLRTKQLNVVLLFKKKSLFKTAIRLVFFLHQRLFHCRSLTWCSANVIPLLYHHHLLSRTCLLILQASTHSDKNSLQKQTDLKRVYHVLWCIVCWCFLHTSSVLKATAGFSHFPVVWHAIFESVVHLESGRHLDVI